MLYLCQKPWLWSGNGQNPTSTGIVVDLESLGQPNTVVGPVKDAVVHPDEDVSQDPEVPRGVLEAAHARSLVVLHWSMKRQLGKCELVPLLALLWKPEATHALSPKGMGAAKASRATGESRRALREAPAARTGLFPPAQCKPGQTPGTGPRQ